MIPSRYFIHTDGIAEGPLDMPIIMRRARAGKISLATEMSKEGENIPGVAADFPEIAQLLRDYMTRASAVKPVAGPKRISGESRLRYALQTGWRYLSQNPQVFMLSSVGVIAAFGSPMLLVGILPWQLCLLTGVFVYLMLQYVVMVTSLRIYRGQYPNAHYLRMQLAPIIPTLALGALVTGLFGGMGLLLFVLPGLVIFSLLAFTPFYIADRGLTLTKAFSVSARTVWRDGPESLGAVMTLVCINLLSMVVIITLPVTLPVIALAMAAMYDDLAF